MRRAAFESELSIFGSSEGWGSSRCEIGSAGDCSRTVRETHVAAAAAVSTAAKRRKVAFDFSRCSFVPTIQDLVFKIESGQWFWITPVVKVSF